jgi:Fe2+ transport system protein B
MRSITNLVYNPAKEQKQENTTMDIKKLQKELEKTLQDYRANQKTDTPEENRAYNAGRLAGFKRALEIIDNAFKEAIK